MASFGKPHSSNGISSLARWLSIWAFGQPIEADGFIIGHHDEVKTLSDKASFKTSKEWGQSLKSHTHFVTLCDSIYRTIRFSSTLNIDSCCKMTS